MLRPIYSEYFAISQPHTKKIPDAIARQVFVSKQYKSQLVYVLKAHAEH